MYIYIALLPISIINLHISLKDRTALNKMFVRFKIQLFVVFAEGLRILLKKKKKDEKNTPGQLIKKQAVCGLLMY